MNEIRPITADMRGIFDAQRAAFLLRGAPPLQERRADLKKLADAIGRIGDRLEAAISADFGNRSRHETKLGEVFPAQSAIRHTVRKLCSKTSKYSSSLSRSPKAAFVQIHSPTRLGHTSASVSFICQPTCVPKYMNSENG